MTKVLSGEGAVGYVGMGPSMRFERGDAPDFEAGRGGVESDCGVRFA